MLVSVSKDLSYARILNMSKQYESLTELIPVMEKDIYGGWNMQQKGDGTSDNPYVMPHASFTSMDEL